MSYLAHFNSLRTEAAHTAVLRDCTAMDNQFDRIRVVSFTPQIQPRN